MPNIDRHIAILAGWIAGPAFGVAMMAAPSYLKLEPVTSGLLFWGGIAVFLLTIIVVVILSLHEEGKRKAVFGPILAMALGALIFCAGAAWYFWPSGAPDGNRWTWDALTDAQSDNLYALMRGKGQYSIHIACNRQECSKLAASFDQLFKRLEWPSYIGEGGFLASGVDGILVNPDDAGARLLKHSIESTTALRIDLGPPRPIGNITPTMLVIGTKPRTLAAGPIVPPAISEQPDVTLRFIYPASPALVLVNQSAALARDIKWSVVLWNMDDPRTYVNANPGPDAHDPLPIPVATFDFLRPHTSGGPQNLFNTPLVAPHIKEGQRLFGSASVICPLCARGHTYIVSIIWGRAGWYVEALNSKEGELLIPPNFKKDTVASYYREILAQTPEVARIPIRDK